MSAKEGKTISASSANPAKEAPLTAAQLQEWTAVIKQLDDNKWVVPAILMAGIAALLDGIHLVFLFLVYLRHWLTGS